MKAHIQPMRSYKLLLRVTSQVRSVSEPNRFVLLHELHLPRQAISLQTSTYCSDLLVLLRREIAGTNAAAGVPLSKLSQGLGVNIGAHEDVTDEVEVGAVEHAPERRFEVGF